MPKIWYSTRRAALKHIAALAICCLAAEAAVAQGWYLGGRNANEYEVGVDARSKVNGYSSAFLKSIGLDIDGFGTLMQDFGARKYLGRRIRLRAFVKTEAVLGSANLWIRVDKESAMLAVNNSRPIQGTTDWHPYEVVLDVSKDATRIHVGVLLHKSGTVWLSRVKFEVVGSTVP